MSFKDKVVLVTGGSSGIGAATGVRFAAEGASVALVGRNQEKLKAVGEQCRRVAPNDSPEPLLIVADLKVDTDVRRIMEETLNRFGHLDVLVNNAGVWKSSNILASDAMEVFDDVMTVNFRSVVQLTNLAAPHLVKTKGNIVNMSSIGALTASSHTFVTNASKAALDNVSRCIALQLAPKGVRVNVINPGPLKTDIVMTTSNDEDARKMVWDLMRSMTALDRISEPEEIADLVLYLASDKARGITGANIVSDNGTMLKSAVS